MEIESHHMTKYLHGYEAGTFLFSFPCVANAFRIASPLPSKIPKFPSPCTLAAFDREILRSATVVHCDYAKQLSSQCLKVHGLLYKKFHTCVEQFCTWALLDLVHVFQ